LRDMPMGEFFFDTVDGSVGNVNSDTKLVSDIDATREAVRLMGQALMNDPEIILRRGRLTMSVWRDTGALVAALTAMLERTT